jgi:polyphosphate kinase 2 (PPK2 family)
MRKRLKDVDQTPAFADEDEYERALELAQLRLLLVQRHMRESGRRALILLEGRDAAGKGGTILRMVSKLDPHHYVVHPIGPPDPWDQGRHHLERFFPRLPRPGQLAIHDRTWYGRVLVERVEKLCAKPAWKRGYDELNELERWFTDDGTPVLKYLLYVSKAEQQRRFEERRTDPFKTWKLTPSDLRARELWGEYEAAYEDVLARTDTEHAPWKVVPADHKWHARVKVIDHAARRLAKAFELSLELPDSWRRRGDGKTKAGT